MVLNYTSRYLLLQLLFYLTGLPENKRMIIQLILTCPKVGFVLSDNVLKPQHDNFVSVKHILLNSKTARSDSTIKKKIIIILNDM